MKKLKIISRKKLIKAVAQSSKMEGLSWSRAKKDKVAIKKLKQHGRAFSI